MPIFSFVTYSSDGLSPFPSYLKLVLQPYVKSGSRLLHMLKKKPFLKFTNDHELAPPLPPFLRGDLSGKVWSTIITTQQEGIYPKSSLGFATYRVSSPAPIYWRIALRVYSPCANILALRILSVKVTANSCLLKVTANSCLLQVTANSCLLQVAANSCLLQVAANSCLLPSCCEFMFTSASCCECNFIYKKGCL